MPPPPIPMQQPYVFMARVHNPDVDGSTSETDRSDNERLQVPHTTPQRQTSGSFFTEQFGYPSMNFTPIPPTRPLPQIRPSSRRNWSRISGHDNLHGPNGPVNPLPNRLQLQAHPDHVNNLLPRQGGHRRAQTASSETLPVFLNQTLGVSPNPAMNPPFHLPQAPSRVGNMNGPYPSRGGGTGGLGSASSETLVPSNSSLGLSGNARTSSSRQTFLGSESNTFVGHHLSRLERPDPAASPHFPTSDQPRGASLPPGLLSPRRHQEGFIRRTNSYETGSSPVNSEMRSFSDTAGSNQPDTRRRAQR